MALKSKTIKKHKKLKNNLLKNPFFKLPLNFSGINYCFNYNYFRIYALIRTNQDFAANLQICAKTKNGIK